MGFQGESSLAGSVAPIRGLVSFGTLTQGSLRFALGFTPSSASRTADWNTRPPHSKAAETVMDPVGIAIVHESGSRMSGVPLSFLFFPYSLSTKRLQHCLSYRSCVVSWSIKSPGCL